MKIAKVKQEKKVIEHNVSPSVAARLKLLESGRKYIEKISWRPYDLPECPCEPIISGMANASERKEIECPKAKGLNRYDIVCKNCGDRLAYFNAKTAQLKNYCNLHYISWYDKDSWHGCRGLNRNPHTMEVNFECCCKNVDIKEPNEVGIQEGNVTRKIKGMPRYTRHKILKA